MKYIEYEDSEKKSRALTGFTHEHFRELLLHFEEAHNSYFTKYDMNGRYHNNRRNFVTYRNSPLPSVEDRLFFILVYIKNNPLQEFHVACFDEVVQITGIAIKSTVNCTICAIL
ncbi:MAG: hypothetical protein LBG92_09315 [Prevotellaceae bacterium]|jgi:hypothetical protein|nr:hypothetical protein [Prevotellaceae bacterium]